MKQIKKIIKEIDLLVKAYEVADKIIDETRTNAMYNEQKANQLIILSDMVHKATELRRVVKIHESISYEVASLDVVSKANDKMMQKCTQES